MGITQSSTLGYGKYFIDKKTGERDKFYISLDCNKYCGPKGFEAAKRDKSIKQEYMRTFGQVGLHGSRLNLSYWGLPSGICEKYKQLFGISKLFDWQAECLESASEDTNLLYSVPTSGGKSLVAELLMLRAVLSEKRRALYVLPYISIVSEKTTYLKKITEDVNIKVEQFHGLSDAGWSPNVDIALATPEKANSIFNRLAEECCYDDISFVVIDEFHLIKESGRGSQIEILIAKILTIEQLYGKRISILAMTATLGNITLYSDFLQAQKYVQEFRPVPLSEYVKSGGNIYSSKNEQLGVLKNPLSRDQDDLAFLTHIYHTRNQSVLIFAPTKLECEKTAKKIAVSLQKCPKIELDPQEELPQAIEKANSLCFNSSIPLINSDRMSVISKLKYLFGINKNQRDS